MKKITYLILLCSICTFAQSQLGNNISGIGNYPQFPPVTKIADNDNRVAVGSWASNTQGTESGQVNIYELNNNSWSQIGIPIEGEAANDNFGITLSLAEEGNIVAIGAPNYDGDLNDKGQVKVFNLENGNWVQMGNTLEGTESNHFFGASVSLSNDATVLAIGAPGFGNGSTDPGQVKVYTYTEGDWNLLGNTIDGNSNDNFLGQVVELSGNGNTLVITDFNYNESSSSLGKVKVYELIANTWVQKGSTIFNVLSDNNLSNSLAINNMGNKLVMGIPGNDDNGTDAGKVQVYEYQNNDWIQIGNDLYGNPQDNYGYSVTINESVISISSPFSTPNGKVDLYENNSNLDFAGSISGNSNNLAFGTLSSLSSNNRISISTLSNNDTGLVEVYDFNALLNITQIDNNIFSIYPNPVSERLYVSPKKELLLNKIEIFTTNGKLIKSIRPNNFDYIDVDGLSQGIYWLRLESDNTTSNYKFIKNK